MNQEDLLVKLEAADQRSRSNARRIEDLERGHEALNRLATAVEVMASKQDAMGRSVDRLAGKVERLEAEPGRRWKLVVEKAICFLAAALMGFVLARAGL